MSDISNGHCAWRPARRNDWVENPQVRNHSERCSHVEISSAITAAHSQTDARHAAHAIVTDSTDAIGVIRKR
jgi:hypothetical protein